ncbi:MAG: hypothetical protein K0R57_324 [Paenibacillaceae bacterium]|jgi:hypothetical protein|nr:hypothetical protein [Paenibacillaceae bacterium]
MLKRTVLFLFSMLIIAGMFLVIKPAEVQACSCAPPFPVSVELERKTAIFSGKAISVVQPEQKRVMSSADPVTITFEVTTVWKGELGRQAVVYTAVSGESCGFTGFVEGKEYIVFAYDSQDRLQTGRCEKTMLLSAAAEELKELGPGYPPQELPAPMAAEPTNGPGGSGKQLSPAEAAGIKQEAAIVKQEGPQSMPVRAILVVAVAACVAILTMLVYRRGRRLKRK